MTDRPTPPPPYDIAVWKFPSGQKWIGFRCRGGSYSWFTPEEAWRVTEDIRARLAMECELGEGESAPGREIAALEEFAEAGGEES